MEFRSWTTSDLFKEIEVINTCFEHEPRGLGLCIPFSLYKPHDLKYKRVNIASCLKWIKVGGVWCIMTSRRTIDKFTACGYILSEDAISFLENFGEVDVNRILWHLERWDGPPVLTKVILEEVCSQALPPRSSSTSHWVSHWMIKPEQIQTRLYQQTIFATAS